MRSQVALADRGKEHKHLTPLQERFLKSGLEGFNDRQIIELLLLCPDLPPAEYRELAKKNH